MTTSSWNDVLTKSFQDIWVNFINFIPNLFIAIAILFFGWIIGAAIGRLVSRLLRSIKVEESKAALSFQKAADRNGHNIDISHLVSGLVRWTIIIVFLIAALDILDLKPMADFFRLMFDYIPNLLAVLAMVLVAALALDLIEGDSDFNLSRKIKQSLRVIVWVFVFLAGMSQLGIAPFFFETLFVGLVAMLALAFGLAFGLGGRHTAAYWLDKMIPTDRAKNAEKSDHK